MDILLVGYDTPGALERYCVKGLRQEGHTVSYFDTQSEFARYCRFRTTPVLSELEQAVWLGRFNRNLVRRVEQDKPDMVLVLKGIEIQAQALERIRSLHSRPVLVNWNPDSPFDITASNTNRNLVTSIPLYDFYFIWDRDLFEPLREVGAKQVEYLPFGYDPDVHFPVSLNDEEAVRYSSDVCFVGGYTAERASLLGKLAEFDLKIWGPNWQYLDASSPLQRALAGGWTHGEEMSRAFSGTGIVLNFIRKQNGQAHNMRTFEAPATASLMLSTRTRDQVGWFPEGEGSAYFESADEMVEKVNHYLSRRDELDRIAARGYDIATTGEHTYRDRMRALVQAVEAY